MQPGFQPGMGPGMQPGFQPGVGPGMQPGMQPGARPPPKKGLGCLVGFAFVLLLTLGPAAFIVPVVLPQQTCDALAPLLGCTDGKAPICTTKKDYSRRAFKRNRQVFSLSLECEEGEGTTTPIWLTSFGLFGGSLLFFLLAVILRARRRRQAA